MIIFIKKSQNDIYGLPKNYQRNEQQLPYQYQIDTYSMNIDERKPVEGLVDIYLKQEGIDRRYSKLILSELYDATQMTNDQLNKAANELITKQSDLSRLNNNNNNV